MDKIVDLVSRFFLTEKSLFPIIRKSIHIVCVLVISNYLYIYMLGEYSFLDVSQYKLIIDFILNGSIILPILFISFTLIFIIIVRSLIVGALEKLFYSKLEQKILEHQYFSYDEVDDCYSTSETTQYGVFISLPLVLIGGVDHLLRKLLATEHLFLEKKSKLKSVKKSLSVEPMLSKYAKPIKESIKSLVTFFILLTFVKVFTVNLPWIVFLISISLVISLLVIFTIGYRLLVVLPDAIECYTNQVDQVPHEELIKIRQVNYLETQIFKRFESSFRIE